MMADTIFLSYSRRDEMWVRQNLIERLHGAGFTVADHQGGPIGPDGALVLVMTPAWVAEKYNEVAPLLSTTRVLPMLVEDCELPQRLREVQHIDLRDGDLEPLVNALSRTPRPLVTNWLIPHPHAQVSSFTGRHAERAMLSRWLTEDAAHPLLVLRGMGGQGKSALAWTWLTGHVDPVRWRRVIWWSFYEAGSFEPFLLRAAEYLSGTSTPKEGARGALDRLKNALHDGGTLLVLDGFERLLRAYQRTDTPESANPNECVSPLADRFLRLVASSPDIRAKVLITTRLMPVALTTRDGSPLAGCREETLGGLPLEDAVAFLHGRGVHGSDKEIADVCREYGQHPLVLELLAGLIAAEGGDISVARRLSLSGDLIERRIHILDTAVERLTPSQRQLVNVLACFRMRVPYELVKRLFRKSLTVDRDLQALRDLGLITRDQKNTFTMHPIVRGSLYSLLPAEERLRIHQSALLELPQPSQPPASIEDLAPAIERYYHTIGAGLYDVAFELYFDALSDRLHRDFHAHELEIELLTALIEHVQQPRALHMLAHVYSVSGRPRQAASVLQRGLDQALRENSLFETASFRRELGTEQIDLGLLREAHASLSDSVDRFVSIEGDAETRLELARLFSLSGNWTEALRAINSITNMGRHKTDELERRLAGYAALYELRRLRAGNVSSSEELDVEPFVAAAHHAYVIAAATDGAESPHDFHPIRALILRGTANYLQGIVGPAERDLLDAQERARNASLITLEIEATIELARLKLTLGNINAALAHAEEVLATALRGEYALYAADAQLILARLARMRGDTAKATDHAKEALRFATCGGPPDFTYKSAYDEAMALLAERSAETERAIPSELADYVKQLRESPVRVAELLARLVLREPGRVNLLETPGVAAFNDAVRPQLESNQLLEFLEVLRTEKKDFVPDPLWLAWIARIHENGLREIAQEISRA